MDDLTQRQQEVLDFLRAHQRERGSVPSLREIARHFGFRSMTAAADHVRALRQKGHLGHEPRQARSHRVLSPLETSRHLVANVPIYGSIPAGLAEAREQEAEGCISVDVASLGIPTSARVFALRVRGDSMIGRHIMNGDIAILQQGAVPRAGDVVAALIDGESTLKTFLIERGAAFLRAENPRYPDLLPAEELLIQGTLVALVRKCR